MAKRKILYMCRNCFFNYHQWEGQCRNCKSWNSLEKETNEGCGAAIQVKSNLDNPMPVEMSEITMRTTRRYTTGIHEFDRVMGGGIIHGSLNLFGGDPGVGKSTLLMKVLSKLINTETLYISGEENLSQIKTRAIRLGLEETKMNVLNETSWETIKSIILKRNYKVIVIDSIQTMSSSEILSQAGSATQLRELANDMMRFCKKRGVTILAIGHITKDGQIAGPKMLEHMVDCVLYFKKDIGEDYRSLNPIKNRFGSVNETGLFKITNNDIIEVIDPSQIILEKETEPEIGAATSCFTSTNKSFLIQLESLVTDNNLGVTKRIASGIQPNKLALIISIIEKKLGIPMGSKDIYFNCPNNFQISDNSIDLGILATLISSLKNKAIEKKDIFIGRISLSGKVREPANFDVLIKTIERLKYKRVFSSNSIEKKYREKSPIKIIGLKEAKDILEFI